MVKVSMLMALLSHLLCTMIYGISPCWEYFTDMTEFGTNDILGQIKIPFPSENKDFSLRVALDINEILSPVSILFYYYYEYRREICTFYVYIVFYINMGNF